MGEGSKYIATTNLDVTVIDCFAQGTVVECIAEVIEATDSALKMDITLTAKKKTKRKKKHNGTGFLKRRDQSPKRSLTSKKLD
ncbi:unnamed protein product [Echinostoma caproni]|uniref:Archease domain-containing protein n=1 Tax=Echinostoma caproni TaxID=27848 RepID=A0A183ABI6_9TREM|nr:unnamed protein product [Echinostoma caproni]